MAQTGYTPIILFNSTTASNAPTTANLAVGELALNVPDGKLYFNQSGTIKVLASNAAGTVGGSNTQVQYNSSGSLAGSANLTFNGTTLTTANDASISGLTVGKGGGAVASNTAVGASALASNTSGGANIAFGGGALQANTVGTNNTALGYLPLNANIGGVSNTAVSQQALFSNTSGSNNAGLGYQSLFSNTTASNNTAVGYQAGYSNTTGTDNLFIGYTSGYSNVSGTLNTYVGRSAGNNSTGSNNTFLGINAGYVSTGSQNTFIGARSATGSCADQMTTGSKNTIIGAFVGNQGGLDIRTASNYIVLSDGDGNPRGVFDASGNYYVGSVTNPNATTYGAKISATGKFEISQNGSGSTFDQYIKSAGTLQYFLVNGSIVGSISATTSVTLYNTTSDYRLKTVIGSVSNAGTRIDALEPIEYDFKAGGRTRGFLAHKFAEVYPNSVTGEKDAVDEEGKPVYQSMQASSSEVMADLIAEIQSLRKRLAALESK